MSDPGDRPAPDPPTDEQPHPQTDDTGPAAPPAGPGTGEPRSKLSGVATSIAGAAGPVISAALRPVGELTSGARRALDERGGGRVRRARRMGREPLVNLWQAHPEARRAAMRELGLRTVPVDQIVGTAVEGATQRGGDFLPLRQLRGQDWRSRWQRILNAMDRLAALPPVDLIKFGDGYWVVDGHNRIAAALYTGQVAVDANVVEMRLPGMPSEPASTNLAAYLESSLELRDAGRGRLTRTAVRRAVPEHPPHDHDEHGAQPDDPPPGGAAAGDDGAEQA